MRQGSSEVALTATTFEPHTEAPTSSFASPARKAAQSQHYECLLLPDTP
ncbi:MAG: hypothetical protein ACI8TP_003507 [Acidimicrobiales bacterium]